MRKGFYLILLVFSVATAACQIFAGAYVGSGSGGQQLGGNQATLQSINLVADNTSIVTGGPATCGAVGPSVACFTATGNYSDGSQRDITLASGAQLISGTPSVLSVSSTQADPWVTTAASGGSSSVTFTFAGVTSNAVVVTVSVLVIIDTNNLPTATQGTAYSYTLTASGGTGVYTNGYACVSGCTGSSPTWTICNSVTVTNNGVISGTPSGTTGSPCSFGMQVTDTGAHTSPTKTLQLSINPSGAGPCGPNGVPAPFGCSNHSQVLESGGSGNLGWPPFPNFTGINSIGFPYVNTCTVAQAGTLGDCFYEPTSGVASNGNAITQMTDATMCPGGAAPSSTGGSQVWMFDVGNHLLAIACGHNGVLNPMPIYLNGQNIVQNGLKNQSLANTVVLAKGNFSTVTPGLWWFVQGHDGGDGKGLQPWIANVQLTVGGVPSSNTGTVTAGATNWVYDLDKCPGLPSPFPVTGSGMPIGGQTQSLNSTNDTAINFGMSDGSYTVNGVSCSTKSAQGCSNVLVTYNTSTNQCATLYFNAQTTTGTARAYAYCAGDCSQGGSNPAPLSSSVAICNNGDLIRQGMHDSNIFGDPQYVRFSHPCLNNDGASVWRVGTTAVGNNHAVPPGDGHAAHGYDKEYSATCGGGFQGLFDLNTWVTTGPSIAKYWVGPSNSPCHGNPGVQTSDTLPLIATTYGKTTSAGISEHNIPFENELVAWLLAYPPGCAATQSCQTSRFGPTFTQLGLAGGDFGGIYGIGAISQDGSMFCFESNMYGLIAGAPFGQTFCYSNLQ